MTMLPDLSTFPRASAGQLDWLGAQGVPEDVLLALLPLRCARGHVAQDGRFDIDEDGQAFLVFPEAQDVVFWQPRTGVLGTWNGRAFALGEDLIEDAATYALGGRLNLLPSPLEWLRKRFDGIVVIDWQRCWSRLHTAPRVLIHEDVLLHYKRHMRPPRGPDVRVLHRSEVAA